MSEKKKEVKFESVGENKAEVAEDRMPINYEEEYEDVEYEDTEDTEEIEEEELTEKEKENIKNITEKDDKKKEELASNGTKESFVTMMTNFKKFIKGKAFDKGCEKIARENNINKNFVKSKYIKNILGTIGDILKLTVEIIGDIITIAVSFIDKAVNNIVYHSEKALKKVISFLTLNCGDLK